jgi:DNA-binding CsgD family transcriptional regulator
MRLARPIGDVLEAIYTPTTNGHAWLEAIRSAANTAFDGHAAAQAFTVRVHEAAVDVEDVAADEPYRSAILASHEHGDAQTVKRTYSPRTPVGTRSDLPAEHPAMRPVRDLGIEDVIGVRGFAERDRVCSISFVMMQHRWRLTRDARVALDRLSAHLAAGWRLRIHDDRADEAVLSANGAVLDAEGAAKSKAARARLREAALALVRAKRESDPIAVLAFWTAMVDGRWTLVERLDSDGKRLLLAKRNAPRMIAHHALTERERLVIERASLAGSMGDVAYELGIPRSTVSETLARALRKLGLRDRAELIEVYTSLCGGA